MTFPNFNPLYVWIFFQVLARVSSLIAVAPVLGAKEVPNPVKTGLALILSMVILPLAVPSLIKTGVPTTLYGFVGPLLLNVVIGITLGFIVSLVILAVQMAGSLLDVQVGFSMAQTFNPEFTDLAAPLTQFQGMYAMLLFLLAHGHYILISALAASFTIIPAAAANLGSHNFASAFTDATYQVLINGLKIAAPAAGILVVIDVAFAFLSRAVPQMNVFFVGMPVKPLAGLALISVVLPLFAIYVGQMVSGTPGDLMNIMKAMHR